MRPGHHSTSFSQSGAGGCCAASPKRPPRATTCLLAVARGIEPDGLGHDVASRAAFRNPTAHDCPPDSRRCPFAGHGEIGEFPRSRRWRGVPTGVEFGRDVGNFPTSFRAYITYAAD